MALEVHYSEIRLKDSFSGPMKAAGNTASASAKQTAQAWTQAGQATSRSLEDVRRRATAVGAGFGTVVAGISLAGRAFQSQEQQIRGVKVAYGDASGELLKFAKHMQEVTIFSDDAARASLLTASTITRQYGIAADQVDELVMRSADLAAIYGYDLANATNRVASAIRGEAEAAESLGIAMSDSALQREAARLGLVGWNTTMTEAEKGQVRFQVLMAQTNYVQGEAALAAERNSGHAKQLMNQIQDLTQAFGGALGPIGEYSAVLGDLALMAPLALAGIGRLGAGLGALGLSGAALGTLGVAGAAWGGAGFLSYDALTNRGGFGDDLFANFAAGGAGIANWLTPGNAFSGIQDQFKGVIAGGDLVKYVNSAFYGSGDFTDEQAVEKLKAAGALPASFTGTVADAANYLATQGASRGMGSAQYVQSNLASNYTFDPVSEKYLTYAELGNYQFTRGQSTKTPYGGWNPGMSFGGPGQQGVEPWFPTRYADPQGDYAGYQAKISEIQSQIDAALTSYLESGAVKAIDLLDAAYAGAPMDRIRAAGSGSVDTGANYTRFNVQADAGNQARSNFQTGYGVTMGVPAGFASDSQQLTGLATDLVNKEGVLGKWDDLVSRGVIDTATMQWAKFRTVQDEANQIFETNAEIQDNVALIQLKQLGYMGDLQQEYGRTIEAIAKMDEAEQRRTLAMMDAGEQSKVSEAATIAYRVATGELSSAIGTDLIKGMAQADPLFADLAEQYGLISRGADGTITVNFPEKDSLIEGVSQLSEEVGRLVELLAQQFNVDIQSNAPSAYESLSSVVGLLNGLADRSVTYYVNEVRTGISIGSPSGVGPTAELQHGGVISGAQHGRVINSGYTLVGESGPELMVGGQGGMVIPASATRASGHGGGMTIREVHIHAHHPINSVDQIEKMIHRAISSRNISSSR